MVWAFGPLIPGFADDVAATGGMARFDVTLTDLAADLRAAGYLR